MSGHSIRHCFPDVSSQTSAPVTISLHSAPVNTSLQRAPINQHLWENIVVIPDCLQQGLEREASTSRASNSTPQAKHLPLDYFQPKTQKLSNNIMWIKTQSQLGNTRVLRSNYLANLPSKMSPVACDSTSSTKTTRSPVLAKRVYRRNTGRDAVDMRQRRHVEGLGNVDLKSASRHVFQGRKRENQASSSKPKNGNSANSVNVNQTARSPTAQASTSADKAARLAFYYDSVVAKQVQAEQEAIRMVRAMGNKNLMQEFGNWNLNWSCSLMTHDTDVTPRDWLCLM